MSSSGDLPEYFLRLHRANKGPGPEGCELALEMNRTHISPRGTVLSSQQMSPNNRSMLSTVTLISKRSQKTDFYVMSPDG